MIIQPNSIVYDGENNSFKVIDCIGSGSFGYVYKIQKESDRTIWALKTLPSTFPNSEQLLSFQNESTLAVKVSHENAVNYIFVHDGNTFPELPPYILMEYADEGTLHNLIGEKNKEGNFISNEMLMDYYHQLINGMEHINSVLIHRDIKPDNILLQNGTIKISDFGLSKVVHDGTRQLSFKGFGHIRYMAPEGWKKEKNTIQMDIYSMGITFYEMATLKHPYNLPPTAEVSEWIRAHSFMNPSAPKSLNPNLSTTVAQVLMKMMEKSTMKRYKNWDEIRKDLLIDNEPVTGNSSIIDNMVNIRLGKDSAEREEQLRQEQAKQEKQDYLNTIYYQYENEIYYPIKGFLEEFNRKYTGGQNRISPLEHRGSSQINTKIHLVSGKTLTIKLEALFDNDFIRDVPSEWDRGRTFQKVRRPMLRGDKKIIAWGYIKSNDATGFNIILVESKDDLYGEWCLLINKNSGFGRQPRPEPFPFEFDELEKEIQVIGALHVYRTEVVPLNIEKFQELIIFNI